MLKKFPGIALVAVASFLLSACGEDAKPASETKALFESYQPSDAERSILFKGVDADDPSAEKSVCVQDAFDTLQKTSNNATLWSSGLLASKDELARQMGLMETGIQRNARAERQAFVDGLVMDPEHVYYLEAIYYDSYFINSSAELLTDAALNMVGTPAFRENCGTQYTAGLGYGGEFYVVFDFPVPVGIDAFDFGLKVQQYFQNQEPSSLISPPAYQVFKRGGSETPVAGEALDITRRVRNFPSEVELQPVVIKTGVQDYEILLNYPLGD